MTILHLKLRKGVNRVRLLQNPILTRTSCRVLRCFVSWSLKNIRTNLNDTLTKEENSTVTNITIPQGYYTFTELKTLLDTHKIEILQLQDNRVSIESKESGTKLHLKTFGTLLGFNQDTTIQADTKTISTVSASMTNKLKDIEIYSNILDYSQIFSPSADYKTYHHYSSLLATLAIDTTQPLNGNFTEYNLNTMKLPCQRYDGQELKFDVKSGGTSEDYEIYMTLEIL